METNQFNFAGFSFPRPIAMLPRTTLVQRLADFGKPKVTGSYYHAPRPNSSGSFFYLESDFMPGLRWEWADEVGGCHLRHTGWYTDDYACGDTIRGIVMRLPHGRGFLAGWSMGAGMASVVETDCVYNDDTDAAYAADSLAEHAADQQREHERKERATADLDE